MRALLAIAFVALVLFAARTSQAHGMRTVMVEVVPIDDRSVDVTMRSAVDVHGLSVDLEGCTRDEDSARFRCPDGWAGHRLTVAGLGPIASEAIVSMTTDGDATTHLLRPASSSWELPREHESAFAVAKQYVGLGIAHIATGWDHLLFLFGLVLCLRRVRLVLLAESAFTISHSVSFSAAALGWIKVPAAWAEACIALSLVLLALDVGKLRERAKKRVAWLAFVFGLVHGLGFAGGLREIGLPDRAVLPALAGFAGGVELGQIAFLAVALALFALAVRIRRERFLTHAGTYAIGAASSLWLIERVVALLSPGGSV